MKEKRPSLSKDQINHFIVYVKQELGIPLRITQVGETSCPILVTMAGVSDMSATIQDMPQEPMFFSKFITEDRNGECNESLQ